MQNLPGGHGIEHEPTASASALRVELVGAIGDARTPIHVLAFLNVIPFKRVCATDSKLL